MEQFKFWFISRRLARHLMSHVWFVQYYPTHKRVFGNAVAVAISPGIKVVAVVMGSEPCYICKKVVGHEDYCSRGK
jgi:hypothetical protein